MIHSREMEIRAALVEHPDLDDRQIGATIGLRRYSFVRLVREAMEAEAMEAEAAAPTPPVTATAHEAPTAPIVAPPLGARARSVLALLQTWPKDPTLLAELHRAYLRARAADFGILERRP